MKSNAEKCSTIDEYIAMFSKDVQKALQKLRKVLA